MEMCVPGVEGQGMTVKPPESSSSALDHQETATGNDSGSVVLKQVFLEAGPSSRKRGLDAETSKTLSSVCDEGVQKEVEIIEINSGENSFKEINTKSSNLLDTKNRETIVLGTNNSDEMFLKAQSSKDNRDLADGGKAKEPAKPALSKEILKQLDQEIIKSIAKYAFPALFPSQNQKGEKQIARVMTKAAKQNKENEKSEQKSEVNERQSGKDDLEKEIEKKNKSTSDSQMEEQQKEKASDHAEKEEKQDDDVVWICFICAKGFPDQNQLVSHQDSCEDSVVEDAPQPVNPEPVPGTSGSNVKLVTSVASKEPIKHPPVPALLRKVGSDIKTLPLGLPNRLKLVSRRQRKFKDIYIPPSRDVYFKSLGLGATKIVQEFFNSPRKSDLDCQIIDLTLEENPLPVHSPMTPRTRSLMSQFSRDESSGRKRQLSFSMNETQEEPKKKRQKKSDTSSDSESSDASEEEKGSSSKPLVHKSLLFGIPLTSPLGQRLKKHWHSEYKVPIISDPELFCSTAESQDDLEEDSKYVMIEKLRHRPPAQVTFKFTKKYLNKWFHSYKFSSADRREFQRCIKTGLCRASRLLKKKMKPCKVLIRNLSQKEIIKWTTPKKKYVPPPFQVLQCSNVSANYGFIRANVSQPLRYGYIPGNQGNMYVGQSRPFVRPVGQLFNMPMTSLLSPNMTGHQMTRLNSDPTPQLLVRTFGPPGKVRLEVMPMAAQLNQSLKNAIGAPHESLPRSQKRKQVFNKVRNDDNLVICLSSDEEEDIPKKSKSVVKQKIGPASFVRKQQAQLAKASSGFIQVPSRKSISHDIVTPKETVSSIVFGQSFRVNTSLGGGSRPKAPTGFNTSNSSVSFTKYRMVNGTILSAEKTHVSPVAARDVAPLTPKISNVVSVDSATWDNNLYAESSVPTSNQPQDGKCVPQGGSCVQEEIPTSQPDSEFMDYEVICLDSDDD